MAVRFRHGAPYAQVNIAMSTLTKIKHFFNPIPKNYQIIPIGYDVMIKHKSGVVVKIDHDGTVAITSPGNLELHAAGNLQITSNTHIGLVAPRIDLN